MDDDLKQETSDGEQEINLNTLINFEPISNGSNFKNFKITNKATNDDKYSNLKCPICAKQCDDDAIVPLNCGHWTCYSCVCGNNAKKCQKCSALFSKIWKFQQVSDEWKLGLEEKVQSLFEHCQKITKPKQVDSNLPTTSSYEQQEDNNPFLNNEEEEELIQKDEIGSNFLEACAQIFNCHPDVDQLINNFSRQNSESGTIENHENQASTSNAEEMGRRRGRKVEYDVVKQMHVQDAIKEIKANNFVSTGVREATNMGLVKVDYYACSNTINEKNRRNAKRRADKQAQAKGKRRRTNVSKYTFTPYPVGCKARGRIDYTEEGGDWVTLKYKSHDCVKPLKKKDETGVDAFINGININDFSNSSQIL